MEISFSTTRELFLLLCEARVGAVVTVRVMGGEGALGDVSHGVEGWENVAVGRVGRGLGLNEKRAGGLL